MTPFQPNKVKISLRKQDIIHTSFSQAYIMAETTEN